ncbi:MAG: hypothetical protein ACOC5F_00275, partial [Candidatus Aminicenantaceae bacterium]
PIQIILIWLFLKRMRRFSINPKVIKKKLVIKDRMMGIKNREKHPFFSSSSDVLIEFDKASFPGSQ